MVVIVNGKPMELEPPCTIRSLLERLDLAAAPCAVEVNRKLVPKRSHADQGVADGDQVEIVTLVGGG